MHMLFDIVKPYNVLLRKIYVAHPLLPLRKFYLVFILFLPLCFSFGEVQTLSRTTHQYNHLQDVQINLVVVLTGFLRYGIKK